MYHEFFGLTQAPFKITPDTRLFYSGGSRGEILEALVYAIDSGEGITKLVGEVGSGKTMLCRMLELRLPDTVEIAYLVNPSLEPNDILHAIALEIGIAVDPNANRVHVMQALHHKLLEKHAAGRQVVVFVEEAQSMPHDTLEEIRLLSNLETQRSKLLQIVLFGQPELDKHLDEPGIRQLRERITHSFYLKPFNKDEIKAYVRFRLQAVGYRGPDMFEDDAYKELGRASQGLTRRVNILADKALLAAFAENTHNVTRRHVRVAIKDSELNTRSGLRWPRYAMATGLCGLALGLGGYLMAGKDVDIRDALTSGVDTASAYVAGFIDQPFAAGAKVEAQPAQAVEAASHPPVDRKPDDDGTEAGSTGDAEALSVEPTVVATGVASASAPVATPAVSGDVETGPAQATPLPEPGEEAVVTTPAKTPVLAPSTRAPPEAPSQGAPSEGPAMTSSQAVVASDASETVSPERGGAQPETSAGPETNAQPPVEPAPVVELVQSPVGEPQLAADSTEQAVVLAEASPVPAALDPEPAAAEEGAADGKTPNSLHTEPALTDTIDSAAEAGDGQRPSTAGDKRNHLVAERLDAARAWLRQVNKNYYTIQLLATDARQAKRLEDLLRSWRKRGTIDRVYIYQTKVGDGTWYGVLYDDYETFAKARAALDDLPAEVKRYKPFIRNVRDLGSFG